MFVKRSERKTTSEDREIFTHPIGVFIAAIVATFYGEAHSLLLLSYAELGIQPQEVGSKYYLLVIVSSYLGLCLLFFKALGKDMSFKKEREAVSTNWLISNISSIYMFYIGMSYSSGIEGAIISGTSSFFQILLAHFLYKDDALNMKK